MRKRVLAAGVLMLAGCAQPHYQQVAQRDYVGEMQTRETARRQTEHAETDALLATVKAGQLPKDYRQKIDQHLSKTLKDPDSRKVEYVANNGAAACGTVNAKNGFGGYAGAQPYGALFDASGNLDGLWIYNDPKLIQWGSAKERATAKACGISF